MKKSSIILISVGVILLVGVCIVAHAYIYPFDQWRLSLSKPVYLRITQVWGPCEGSAQGSCQRVVTLGSDDSYSVVPPEDKAVLRGVPQKSVEQALVIYKSQKCTPVYGTDMSEEYQIIDDTGTHGFVGNQAGSGCKEMQDIVKAVE